MEAGKENIMSDTVFHHEYNPFLKIQNFCQLYLTAVEQQRALCALAQYNVPGRYLLTCSIDNQSEAAISGQ